MMAEADEPKDEKRVARLLALAKEWANKIVPGLLLGVILAGVSLYTDNIGNKRDIAREAWRNDKQDERDNRIELRQDRLEEVVSDLREVVSNLRDNQAEFQNDQSEFKTEALRRLGILLGRKAKERQ